ncbi:MAG: LacI family transcriptional regulator [Endomicrobia bacterium]|nr:LacI family transcriptional regulator [Endomicrobiia bacterium]
MKISDIAKRCNVSTATVSLVLSNNPRISEKTKQKVLKIIKELGYYPNIAARALSRNRTNTLCVVIPQISNVFTNPFFAEVLSGIYDCVSQNNYRILLEVATYEFCLYKKYLQLFKERSIDGMLYVGSTLKDKYLIDIEKENLPFFLVGSYFPKDDGPELSYVISDNVTGGYLATKHLINLGHRKIGFITGHFKIISARDRYIGYKKALKEAKITFDSCLIAKADFDEKTGYSAAKKLLSLPKSKRPTAIFAGNDLMAIGAITAVRDFGMKVPQDIAIVGMDNLKISFSCEPPLTTVDYNIYDMGKVACHKLIEQIETGKVQKEKIILPVKLIIRSSCGFNNSLVQMYEKMQENPTKNEFLRLQKKYKSTRFSTNSARDM